MADFTGAEKLQCLFWFEETKRAKAKQRNKDSSETIPHAF
jgi:hypothetical protein